MRIKCVRTKPGVGHRVGVSEMIATNAGLWREGGLSGESWYFEAQFPLDHGHLCRRSLGRKSGIEAKLDLSSVLAAAGVGGQRGRRVGRRAVTMLFLCSHIYLVDKMGPAFRNWKSFPHNLKQHLPLPVAVTGRLIPLPAMQVDADANWLHLQARVMPSLHPAADETGTAGGRGSRLLPRRWRAGWLQGDPEEPAPQQRVLCAEQNRHTCLRPAVGVHAGHLQPGWASSPGARLP